MKKTVFGLILGLLLGVTTTVYAASITNNAFPILVNGAVESVQAYNIDGYTYLKLADVGNCLDATVKFNESSKRIEITTSQSVSNEGTRVNDAIKKEEYIFKSDVLDLSGMPFNDHKGEVIQQNGEFYLTASAFTKNSIFEKPYTEMTFKINDNEIKVSLSDTNYFLEYYGNRFVKLSALGLTGTINGDTLTIE